MKLQERNQMYQTRFSQSLGQLSSNHMKQMGTTRSSFGSARGSIQLPTLNRSLSKSTTGKLANLDQQAQQLLSKVHNLRLQTRETRRFANFLKEDLGDRKLTTEYQTLLNKVRFLDKYCKLTRSQHEQRTQLLHKQCDNLQRSSTAISELIEILSGRIDNAEHCLGIYSGKQKHKV